MPPVLSATSSAPDFSATPGAGTSVIEAHPSSSFDIRASVEALIEEAQMACMTPPAIEDSWNSPAAPTKSDDCGPDKPIVVGIDGTGSASWRRDPKGGTPLFVEQLVNKYDTPADHKLYLDGPERGQRLPDTRGETQNIEDRAVRFVREQREACPDSPVHVAGYSRGGFVAMQVVDRLAHGENPIPVQNLILLDPVDSDLGYGETDSIPRNVAKALVVAAAPAKIELLCAPLAGCTPAITEGQSRAYFRRPAARPEDPAATQVTRIETRGTHAAIGGAPGTGDRPIGYSDARDRLVALEVEAEMLAAARSVGAKLTPGIPMPGTQKER